MTDTLPGYANSPPDVPDGVAELWWGINVERCKEFTDKPMLYRIVRGMRWTHWDNNPKSQYLSKVIAYRLFPTVEIAIGTEVAWATESGALWKGPVMP